MEIDIFPIPHRKEGIARNLDKGFLGILIITYVIAAYKTAQWIVGGNNDFVCVLLTIPIFVGYYDAWFSNTEPSSIQKTLRNTAGTYTIEIDANIIDHLPQLEEKVLGKYHQ